MPAATFAPTVTFIGIAHGGAGQIVITVHVKYPGMDNEEIVFSGSTYGNPGPVHVRIQGWSEWLHVDSPERHGEHLNESWVRSYFS